MFRWRNIVAAAVRNSGGCFKEGNLEVFIRKQSTMGDKFRLPDRFGTGEKSVWVEYIALAAEVKPAVNLGQGFPDYPMPKHASEALARIACSDNPLVHQYTRGFGHPRLVQALANLYSPLIGRELDPLNEIIVSTGAYEALYCAILGHVSPGEEVIIIEPFFDCYEYMVRIAGGIPKFISLEALKKKCECLSSADWHFDEEEMKNLFNPTTKMIILNTPHNPLGKVFKKEELEFIADLCKQHNVLCLADEVYEWMVYKPNQHIRMATLPGMWERTITVGSAGKTFSATGWKIGWAYGPANLMNNLQVVHQNCVYTCCTPIQEAIAQAFETELARRQSPECFLNAITDELLPKRDYMVKILKANGFKPTIPEGGYFIIADWTKLKPFIDLTTEQDSNMDYRFTKKLAKVAGVLAIPPSAFYGEENKKKGEDYARFCFIKKQENLQLAESLLTAWRN